jgi:8-oxo-dGTP pyrophosphatase MutT (NUDIX family)
MTVAPGRAARLRHAATVVLLRDGRSGPEVYLLRRVRGMAFAAGMTVFPGGAVDQRDADAAITWSGPPPDAWSGRLAADPTLARALVCAAVRETFEESGVLLATPVDGGRLDLTGPGWEDDRHRLEVGELPFAAVLARRRLALSADLLWPWAHWITPVGEPRRYDTRFLVAALPGGQSTREVSPEAEAAGWARPADALAQAERGERALMPPTLVTLTELAGFETVADVLAAALGRVIEPVTPTLVRTAAGELGVELPDGRTLPLPRVPA